MLAAVCPANTNSDIDTSAYTKALADLKKQTGLESVRSALQRHLSPQRDGRKRPERESDYLTTKGNSLDLLATDIPGYARVPVTIAAIINRTRKKGDQRKLEIRSAMQSLLRNFFTTDRENFDDEVHLRRSIRSTIAYHLRAQGIKGVKEAIPESFPSLKSAKEFVEKTYPHLFYFAPISFDCHSIRIGAGENTIILVQQNADGTFSFSQAGLLLIKHPSALSIGPNWSETQNRSHELIQKLVYCHVRNKKPSQTILTWHKPSSKRPSFRNSANALSYLRKLNILKGIKLKEKATEIGIETADGRWLALVERVQSRTWQSTGYLDVLFRFSLDVQRTLHQAQNATGEPQEKALEELVAICQNECALYNLPLPTYHLQNSTLQELVSDAATF